MAKISLSKSLSYSNSSFFIILLRFIKLSDFSINIFGLLRIDFYILSLSPLMLLLVGVVSELELFVLEGVNYKPSWMLTHFICVES